jgi:hypothetical protein
MAEVRHNQGEAGGYLVGRRHSNGGIKAVNKSTGQPLEMEGGEVVITRDAVTDTKKRSFNGKMMTNRQILSEINQSGGGVAFADGGEVPDTMHFNSDAEYEYGGKTMCGCDLATEMSKSQNFEEGGSTDSILLAEVRRIEFLHEGWYNGYSGDRDNKFYGRGPYDILMSVLNAATSVDNTSLKYSIKLIIDKDEELIVVNQQSYQEILDKGVIEYQDFIQECESKILGSGIQDAPKIAALFKQITKMYLLGISGRLRGSSEENIPVGFTQEEFGAAPSLVEFEILSNKNMTSGYVEEKSNFKDWEKGIRKLNKEVKEETGKLPTSLAFADNLRLANLSDGFFQPRAGFIITEKKPLVTKWEWWKENVFSKTNAFVEETGKDRTIRLNFSEFDCTPYEQELGNIKPNARSRNKRNTAEKLAKDILVGKKGFSFFSSSNQRNQGFDDVRVMETYKTGDYDFGARVLKPDSLQSNTPDVYVDVRQRFIFFVGEDGLFAFNQEAREYGNRENFVFVVNEEGKKAAAALQAVIEEARAAERKAARDAVKAEKQRQEELKNRKFRVRDQPEDFDFLMPEDADNDVNRALNAEKQALVAMLKMAQSPKNFNMRKIILKKIAKIEKTLEGNRLNESGNEQIDVKKLMTPKGLMDYYFNQARQNPVKKMNEACGLETPTGVPSKLSLQAYRAVRTKYFKRWFGDWESAAASGDYTNCSKIVDPETKEPRIMYHGVRRYDPRVKVSNMGQGVTRPYGDFKAPNFPATYFGSDLSYVEFYAGMAENQPHPDPNYEGFMYYVFLNMRNPIMLDGLGVSKYGYQDLLAYLAINYGMVVKPSQDLLQKIQGNRKLKAWNYIRNDLNLIATIKKAGFDGIIQVGDVPTFTPEGKEQDIYMNGDEYLTFNANQVKSAIVKNSFYMSAIDDVRFKDGGYVRI